MTTPLLKLKAKDAEDVQVISAVLQDAIAPVIDMTYRPEDRNFIMVVHRLRRESGDKSGPERICCAINLRGAESVQTQGVDLEKRGQILDLLAIMQEGHNLRFVFAGEAQIKVQLAAAPQDNWSVLIEDFGDPWPASCSPCHDAALKGEKA
jgi:hypothetical protein